MARIGCAAEQVKTLKPAEARELLDKDATGDFVLLDVGQPEEYATGHIPGALPMPLTDMETRQSELDRRKKYIVYSRSDHRSRAAAVELCVLGFADLYVLEGGAASWPYGTVPGVEKHHARLLGGAEWSKDILMLAIKLEKGSVEFYTRAAEKMKTTGSAELFRDLIGMEEKHMLMAYEQSTRFLGRGALPTLEELKRDLKVDYMEGGVQVDAMLASVEDRFDSEVEALEVSLEKEYLAYDFYRRASLTLLDIDGRAVLRRLAQAERHHADIVLNRLSSLVE